MKSSACDASRNVIILNIILSNQVMLLLHRAARTIQIAWRAYVTRKIAAAERARRNELENQAAFVITNAMRTFALRLRYLRIST